MKTLFESPPESTHLHGGETSTLDNSSPEILHFQRILVPVKFPDVSPNTLELATLFARSFHSEVTLLHVLEPKVSSGDAGSASPHENLKSKLDHLRDAYLPPDISVNSLVEYNFLFDGILGAARRLPADLIVMTTYGREELFSPASECVTAYVVDNAPCPVLIVRASA